MIVALLLVPLIGFAALAIDVAAIHTEKQQLQMSADAAALAVAQDCAGGDCGPSPVATAQSYATWNQQPDGDDVAAEILTPALTPFTGEVVVRTTGVQEHWFAPVLDDEFADSTINAEATAQWGTFGGGKTLPLIFSLCKIYDLAQKVDGFSYDAVTKTFAYEGESSITVIELQHPSDSSKIGSTMTDLDCSQQGMPGGFSWIVPDSSGVCSATTSVDSIEYNYPGNVGPSGCTATYLREVVDGGAIPLPIYDKASEGGANGEFVVFGYVGFDLTGLFLKTQAGPAVEIGDTTGCKKGNGYCLVGKFTDYEAPSGDTDPNAPNLGTTIVRLVK